MGVLGIVGTAADTAHGFGRYETKRLWQYKLEFFDAFGADTAIGTLLAKTGVKGSLTIAAKTVARPTATFSEVVIKHGNEAWKLAGKTNWASENIEVMFDDVIPAADSGSGDTNSQYSVAAIMYEWQNIIQDITTGAGELAKQYKANIRVTQFSPDTKPVERILYHGAWPSSVKGEQWDYENEDGGNKVGVTFTFDKAFRLSVSGSDNTPPSTIIGTADEDTASTVVG